MFEKKFSRRDFIKMSALATAAFAIPNFFPSDVQAAKTCSARTRYGIYNGFVGKRGVKTWLGIPYAKPPVGNLRWHAPEKLEPSNSEFDAKKLGFSPMQDLDEFEAASLLPQGEDCLTLNIWTRGAKNNLPVMVFIPGGGFVGGGSGDPIYNGANLAANHDVVVVTINYRVNIFGFMNFAAIDSAFEDSGYLGIKDQIAALTWIKENILEFGGDPVNITIFGESAGAASATLLMVTPAAQGLFKKVIAQSGHLAFYHTFDQSAHLAENFMELGGYKNMRELMNKPAKELMTTYVKLCDEHFYTTEIDYFPTCDGKYLPAHPLKALYDGAARDVKFLTGTTAEEYRYWAVYFDDMINTIEQFHAELRTGVYEGKFLDSDALYQTWAKNHPEFAALESGERYLEFADQLDWRVGQELAAEYQSKFNDVYFYLFSQKSPNKKLGSCHAIDLPFVFNNPSKDLEPKPSANLVKQVQAAWVSFAATGNPNNSLVSGWKPYTFDNRQTMEINSKAWTCHKDLNVDNLATLRHVYEDNLLG